MKHTIRGRSLVVVVLAVASTTAFAEGEPDGRNRRASKATPSRGILEGIDILRHTDVRVVEEEIPADAPTIMLLNDKAKSRGRVAADIAETFVYKNFSEGRNNQTGFFFNWAATSGGGDPEFSPVVTVPGIFEADGAVFGNGFKAGKTAVSSYEIFAFRSSSDPDTEDLAFVSMELWDGDPANALDGTGVGECRGGSLAGEICVDNDACPRGTCVRFTAAPIPGTKVTFSGVPVNSRIVFRGELDPPVVTPHARVWVVVTSDACRFGWFLARTKPTVGSDDAERLNSLSTSDGGLFIIQSDTDGATNGLGVCCGDNCDGAPCDLDGPAGACCDDPTGSRNQCVDGDAEDMGLFDLNGTCTGNPATDGCANFWLNVMAEAEVRMSIQPTGNGALGSLVDGARIEGNEIIMVSGGENVMMDLQLSNFAPDPNTVCVGGVNDGMPCSRANEVADCGAIGGQSGAFGCGVKLAGCQSELDSESFTSGIAGELSPMDMACTRDSDCLAAFGGACSISGGPCRATADCPGANASPADECSVRAIGSSQSFCDSGKCRFVYFSSNRSDYLFRGSMAISGVDTTTPDIRWGLSLRSPPIDPLDPYPARGLNVAQLIMTTSADAKGTFTLALKPGLSTFALDAREERINLVGLVPAKITVENGQCCNLDPASAVCLTDQVTAAGCAAVAIDNGIETLFDPNKTCADECAVCVSVPAPVAEATVVPKNRYLSFTSGSPTRSTALQVTFVDLPPPHDVANGRTMWVGPPEIVVEHNGKRLPEEAPTFPTLVVARLQCEPFVTNWGAWGTINVYHEGIIPGSVYDIREIGGGCALDDAANLSAPLPVVTSAWGDIVGDCMMTPCSPPNGVTDIVFDAISIIDKLRNVPTALSKSRMDLRPSRPDQRVNIIEVTRTLDAFRGVPYPFDGPSAMDPCSP